LSTNGNTNLENLIDFVPSIDYPNSLSDISDISDILSNDNPISITTCLRLNEGNVTVHGTIASYSRVYKMIKSVSSECENCSFIQKKEYKIPILDYPNNIFNKKCIQCEENHQKIAEEYINAVKIEIQDSDTFSEIEKLSCILFDEGTTDIQIGSKVIVAGSIQIIKQKNKKSIPFVYASSIHYENKENLELSDRDIDALYRFKELKKDSLIEALTKMFAPSIIGLGIVKKGILLSAVSSSEGPNLDENRDRMHILLVGNPGTGKSKLTKECVKLVPNSRFESSQHASGKSLTAIVTKEDEDFCLRIGPVPLARDAICVLNEIGRTTPEDQGFLLDVMEEGEFTINKYGINAKIKSPTVIIASANPFNPANGLDDKINIYQIPIIKPVIDRFDLMFVLKDSTDEGEVRAYADKKTKQ
jgi:replicative DNA helicase Mcm